MVGKIPDYTIRDFPLPHIYKVLTKMIPGVWMSTKEIATVCKNSNVRHYLYDLRDSAYVESDHRVDTKGKSVYWKITEEGLKLCKPIV